MTKFAIKAYTRQYFSVECPLLCYFLSEKESNQRNLREIESVRGRSREGLAVGYAISIAPLKHFLKASKSQI